MTAPAHRWGAKLPEFAKRALQHDQMEFDSALSQMWALCTNPSLVSKISKARKMTKNYYYRDDPAFVVLQCFFIVVVTLAYGLATGSRAGHILYEVVYQLTLNYLALGALLATGTWLFANKFLMGAQVHLHEVRREVEWQHSFDIHCNGYFPYFIWTHVVQYALLPLLLRSNFFAQMASNTLFAVGVVSYCYSTLHGYLELPTLVRQEVFLYPAVAFVGVLGLLTITTHINLTHWVIHSTWPAYA